MGIPPLPLSTDVLNGSPLSEEWPPFGKRRKRTPPLMLILTNDRWIALTEPRDDGEKSLRIQFEKCGSVPDLETNGQMEYLSSRRLEGDGFAA